MNAVANTVDDLPPHSPEAERGVLGCCLIDPSKTSVAVKAGVNPRWFYDGRHAELFSVLMQTGNEGSGDLLLVALRLRDRGKLEGIGGIPYLTELLNAVPSAENLEYYLPDLKDRFQRRQVIQAATRLQSLAGDSAIDSTVLLNDTEMLLEAVRRQSDAHALPDIVPANDFLANELPAPGELIAGVLHQGSKLILGGASKSYKTWGLTDLAISVATGIPWLGFQTTPGKVLYVNLEIQPSFFRRRIGDVVEAKQVELTHRLELWNLRGYAADYRRLLPKIHNQIRDQKHALVILDPTYKLLGTADENSATDISALLNTIESLAVSTGAAVAMAGHFAKGNPSAKETIDRISGSGVFARDPDSLVIFTKHEEEKAFAVEMVLRNFPPVEPFVVRWEWPLFRRDAGLDPSKLKSTSGRPNKYRAEDLLHLLGDKRLRTGEWLELAMAEGGFTRSKFFEVRRELETAKSVHKSKIDEKWEKLGSHSKSQTVRKYNNDGPIME